jgi:NitT/TauT family transport system ATP-binding protein
MAPLIEIRDLGKRFPAREGREPPPWVIRDLSFSVRPGELLTIIGPSGAGKSTLLNMIAQIETISAGEIVFDGETAKEQDARALRPGFDRRIGYVTQDDNLLPWRTTIDNVLFPIEVQGRLNAQTRAHAEMLVRAVGLAGFERYYPHELSGGMRKRAALIRTLAYDPPVILMDEPFAAVDAQTREILQFELLHIWEQRPTAMVFVTHSIEEAVLLGHRVIVLKGRPSSIHETITIDLPSPRTRETLREPRFAELRERVWGTLMREAREAEFHLER